MVTRDKKTRPGDEKREREIWFDKSFSDLLTQLGFQAEILARWGACVIGGEVGDGEGGHYGHTCLVFCERNQEKDGG